MQFERGSGILLHLTSLPSGDLGSAREFIDRLVDGGQKYWQVLPLGPTSYGGSPYGCLSAFAGNPQMIGTAEAVTLNDLFEDFKRTDDKELAAEFHRFCDENWFWLDDYSLFTVLREINNYAAWNEWELPLRSRDKAAIEAAKKEHDEAMFAEKFRQFTFFREWYAVKKYANEKGIKIIGDIPIYVAFDSADVWCNQARFKLNEDGSPTVVSGVPPDFFSSTGQRWGNPIYDWDVMRKDGFSWWIERVHINLRMFDIVRLDHFIGFTRAWEIPGEDETAENGEWISVPGFELFRTLKNVFDEMPFIAEDLGEVTDEVRALRDDFEIAGLRILQFAFGGDAYNTHLPHNYIPNAVVYTGTHDNETTIGWFKSAKKKAPHIQHCLKYLKSSGKEINWDMISAAYGSVATIAIVPMQDVLGLDNSARMNTPSTTHDNWSWRLSQEQFDSVDLQRLKDIAAFYAR